MSEMTARFQARIEGLRPSSTICAMACFSSPSMAGMPTSIWCTPTSSSRRAMRIFSWFENTTPAVCSPSRRVVSSMRTGGPSAGASSAMTKLDRSPGRNSLMPAPLRSSPASAARTSSPTSWGLPLPCVAFMTWPTKKPASCLFAGAVLLDLRGVAASTAATAASSSLESETWPRSWRATMSAGSPRSSTM